MTKQHLVKIIKNEDGEPEDPYWHWVNPIDDSPRAFCSGQVFGYGEGVATYEEKFRKSGGIDCPNCILQIKQIKAIRLS